MSKGEVLLSLVSRIFEFLYGVQDSLFYALVAFVIIDYITGICLAIYNKQINSAVGFHGIAKKVTIFLLVFLSHIIDKYLVVTDDILRNITTLFYIVNEGMSIFENVGAMGLPLPDRLKHILQYFENLKK